jgi:hypothetical protein
MRFTLAALVAIIAYASTQALAAPTPIPGNISSNPKGVRGGPKYGDHHNHGKRAIGGSAGTLQQLEARQRPPSSSSAFSPPQVCPKGRAAAGCHHKRDESGGGHHHSGKHHHGGKGHHGGEEST